MACSGTARGTFSRAAKKPPAWIPAALFESQLNEGLQRCGLPRAGPQKFISDRVGNRLERGIDNIGRDPDRRPTLPQTIAKFSQNPCHRIRSTVKDANTKIDKFEIFNKRLIFTEIFS